MSAPRNPTLRKIYDAMLALANDPNSELYFKGRQHRAAVHRCAFWDGFNGISPSPHRGPNGSLTAACYAAGIAYAKRAKEAA
jgi:hypothetical protein